MSIRTAAALLWGCAFGLVVNLVAIHSPRAAVMSVFTFALLFVIATLWDEWHRTDPAYWTTRWVG